MFATLSKEYIATVDASLPSVADGGVKLLKQVKAGVRKGIGGKILTFPSTLVNTHA